MGLLTQLWEEFDTEREKKRKKAERSSGFAKKSLGVYYPIPGEGFVLPVLGDAGRREGDAGGGGEKAEVGSKHHRGDGESPLPPQGPLRIFSDVPIHRILERAGSNTLSRLMLKGAGIGYHGALVLAALLRRTNTLSHLYLSDNDIGTRGAIALAESICETNRSVKFIDMRGNGIECKAIAYAAKVLEARLDRSYYEGEDRSKKHDPRRTAKRPPVGNGWCPPPALNTWDWQNNVIGGFGVSAELPGISEYLSAFRRVVQRRAELDPDSPASASVYLGGNQIRPGLARGYLAEVQGTRLDLFIDVRQ